MVFVKNVCLQMSTDVEMMENGDGEKKDPLCILSSTGHRLYQRVSNVPLEYV